MDFKITENGNLEISRTRKDMADLREIRAREPNNDLIQLCEILELTGWAANGRLYQINPEDVAALTDAPMLADDVSYEDDGTVLVPGNVFWYSNYQVSNFFDVLYKEGKVIFQKAEKWDEDEKSETPADVVTA